MKLVVLNFLFLMLFISCKSVTNAEKSIPLEIIEERGKMDLPLKAKVGNLSNEVDSVLNLKIKSVNLSGNYLEIEFTYRGGCELHDFEFIGSSKIAKSMPPVRAVQLVHSVKKPDLCKKMVIQKIKIDVSELAYKKETGSEIFLSIQGWDEKVKYIFEAN